MSEFTLFLGGPFSQWTHCNFTVDEEHYTSCEQYMMAEKAKLFGDEDARQQIMNVHQPSVQKTIGREVKGFIKDEWEKIEENGKPYCWNVVYKGNMAKFTQNPGFQEVLLNTGDTLLVEASPSDRIWGIGLREDDPKALDRDSWRGTNWLGEVLTQVREDIRNTVSK